MASPGLARYSSALNSPPCTSPGSPAAPPVVTAALLLLGLPALLATLGRVKTLLAEERLLLGAEGELAPAVGARQTLLAHLFPPFFATSFAGPSSLSMLDIASGINSRKCAEALPPSDASAWVAGRTATT